MSAFTYEYKMSGLVKAPAQKVGELLEELMNSPDGLSPKTLLNASREEGSLLHNDFEWNDGIAAEKFRLGQARFIIQNVVIVQKTNDQEEREICKDRAYVSVSGKTGAYVALNSALTNDEWRRHILKCAKNEMETFCAKYARLSELASVIEQMKIVESTI